MKNYFHVEIIMDIWFWISVYISPGYHGNTWQLIGNLVSPCRQIVSSSNTDQYGLYCKQTVNAPYIGQSCFEGAVFYALSSTPWEYCSAYICPELVYTIIKAQLALILPHKAIVGWYLRENLLIKDKQELYVPPQIQELNTVCVHLFQMI